MNRSLHLMMVYFISHLGLIFFMFPYNIISSTKQGYWFPVLIGVLTHFILLIIYLKGLQHFPKKDIISIFSEKGKWFTLFLTFPLLIYFVIIIIITVRAYAEIITIVFLANTPVWAILILLLSISMFMAVNGVEVIFRTGFLLSIILIPIILVISVSSFQNIDWHFALPINSKIDFLEKKGYYQSYFAFTSCFLFLGFVRPYITYTNKKVLLAAVCLIPFYFLAVYIPVLTFGPITASTTLLPYVVVVDAININWLMFDRVTMFFLLSLIAFVMLFLSLAGWQAARIIQYCIPKLKSSYLVIILFTAIYFSCFLLRDWQEIENLSSWNSPLRFYVVVTIPLAVFILGKRKARRNADEKA
jgi:Spore germination protein